MENKKTDYTEELKKNGVIAFVPGGNSMWPTLKSRKQSVIVKKKEGKLSPLDVALYRRENGINVLHRVIKATEFGYVMCGDSQFVTENVKEDQVCGVMVGFYRGKKYIETTDPDYIKEVKDLYSDEKSRRRKVKRFFFFLKIKSLPIRAIGKIFGRKKKKGEENELS